MGYFVVYFCIIIKFESGYMHSLQYAGRQDGFRFLVFIVIVLSLVDNELFLMNYQRHRWYLGSSFPLTSSSGENFIFLKNFFCFF